MVKYHGPPNTMGSQTVGQQTSQKNILGDSPPNTLSQATSLEPPSRGEWDSLHPSARMSVQ